MTGGPEPHYLRTDDGTLIAYAVSGAGPTSLVPILGWPGHLEALLDFPPAARFCRRLESFSRLVRWDQRGAGLSDRADSARWPPLEDHARDLLAVLDAVDVRDAALYGNGIGGLLTIFIAATFPERVSRVVLDGCYARYAYADDFPIGTTQDVLDSALNLVGSRGLEPGPVDSGFAMAMVAPSFARDPELHAAWSRIVRTTNSPRTSYARAEVAVYSDLRPLLGSIRAPTLVLYRAGDRFAGRRHAEYLSEHITGARLVELPGVDNLSIAGDQDATLGEVEEFLTGQRTGPETERILATVLFTDIVQSTDLVATLGDRRWRDLLDRHDQASREEIERCKGRFVKTTGDGVVATFDGPARGIRCAQAITRRASTLGLEVRSGLHTGEVEFRGDDLHGLAVHVAQRVSSGARAGEVLVSRTVVDLVAGSDLTFEDRGEHDLKGVPGSWRLFLAQTS